MADVHARCPQYSPTTSRRCTLESGHQGAHATDLATFWSSDPHESHTRPPARQAVTASRVDVDDFSNALTGEAIEVELAQRMDAPTAPQDELRIYARCDRGRHLIAMVAIEHDGFGRARLALEVTSAARLTTL